MLTVDFKHGDTSRSEGSDFIDIVGQSGVVNVFVLVFFFLFRNLEVHEEVLDLVLHGISRDIGAPNDSGALLRPARRIASSS